MHCIYENTDRKEPVCSAGSLILHKICFKFNIIMIK